MPDLVKAKLTAMLAQTGGLCRRRTGLCVSVFEASPDKEAGVPDRDLLWYSGYAVAALQLGVSAIPWALYGVWQEFAVTALGTALSFLTASLQHWTQERWACDKESTKTFVLTRGNGTQHAIVIVGAGRGLDLEDLAISSEGVPGKRSTPILYSGLAVLWCVLLITVCGIKNRTWCLLGVGTIGMMHTIIIAGAPRQPGLFGIHLTYKDVLREIDDQDVLPGDLREDEQLWWKAARERERASKKGAPHSMPPNVPIVKLEGSSSSSVLPSSTSL
ncbi:hypothetical protein PG993_007014 [Apiospora rasikravindrae]|uniref:Uncharacterized protein n=1 Tax=Apiospora rasikravindrae TaxID=990691 RepID=A0ABR1SWC8_9PEZI